MQKIDKKSTAEYASEENITFFYLVIFKFDDSDEMDCSCPYPSKKEARDTEEYKLSKYKRIIRIEARENWLKRL